MRKVDEHIDRDGSGRAPGWANGLGTREDAAPSRGCVISFGCTAGRGSTAVDQTYWRGGEGSTYGAGNGRGKGIG